MWKLIVSVLKTMVDHSPGWQKISFISCRSAIHRSHESLSTMVFSRSGTTSNTPGKVVRRWLARRLLVPVSSSSGVMSKSNHLWSHGAFFGHVPNVHGVHRYIIVYHPCGYWRWFFRPSLSSLNGLWWCRVRSRGRCFGWMYVSSTANGL